VTVPTPVRRARPRRRRGSILLGFVLAAVAFVVGIALGESLHENPKPGGTQTLVRTLRPLPLAPAAHDTVTITTTK
jgi:hypothetical protein